MQEHIETLKARFQEVDDLQKANAVLNWDQSTYMPPKGAVARGRQSATLSKIAQEKLIDPEIGKLLDKVQPYAESLDADNDDARLIKKMRRDYDEATKIPPALIGEFTAHVSESYAVWAAARHENNFEKVKPYLQKTIDFSRKIADCFPGYDHIADPLINFSDYGMKAASVKTLFAELRGELVPLVEAIAAKPMIDDSCLRRSFSEKKQLAFGLKVAKDYGLDMQRSRQDKTHHPFMTSFALDDVRITTRVQKKYLAEALFSTLHETGHALYELGGSPTYEGTPLEGGTSSGVHESQSRLWENIVGRSRGFWQHYYPQLQSDFSRQLSDVSLNEFYRAINKVERSLIRTDADEVTYNLHVMIRFDLSLALLEGTLSVDDLPEAWHARYESDLGVRAPSDVNGVMQDVHWYAGTVGGAFQGYTLGNIMSGQIYEAALAAHPEIEVQIGKGEFGTLHGWLKDEIYQHASKYTPNEIIERATGKPLSIQPYMTYLKGKYGALYGL